MDKKVILITGASSGFGYDVAQKLLEMGSWEVYTAARRLEKMKDLVDLGAHVIKMDVTDDVQVDLGVKQIIAQHGRIDAVLANAGYGTYGTIETISIDEIKYQYDVNVFGVARTIKAVLPTMRKQKSGRIVLTSSLVSNISMKGLGWYASTKHAIKAVGIALRQEMKSLGIKVVMIEPGAVKTGFDRVALDTLRKIDFPSDYKDDMEKVEKYLSVTYEKCPDAKKTVDDIIKAITVKNPKAIYRTTLDSKMFSFAKRFLSEKVYDKISMGQIK